MHNTALLWSEKASNAISNPVILDSKTAAVTFFMLRYSQVLGESPK